MKQSFLLTTCLLASLPLYADLRMTEICPKPTSADPNGAESGWIELTNTGSEDESLASYKLLRANRGKKAEAKSAIALPEGTVKPGESVIIYTSEDDRFYTHSDIRYIEDTLVYGAKINPKKYPCVWLYKGTTEIDRIIVPVDIPENMSIAPGLGTTATSTLIDKSTSYSYRLVTDSQDATWQTGHGTLVIEKNPADTLGDNKLALSDTDFIRDEGIAWATEPVADSKGILREQVLDFSVNATEAADGNRGAQLETDVTKQLSDLYTVSLWFKTPQATNPSNANMTGTGMPLFECRPSNSSINKGGMIVFVNDEQQISVQPRNADRTKSSTFCSDTDATYTDGEWHHLLLISGQKEGETLQLYIDGQREIDTNLTCDAELPSFCRLNFGRAYDSTSWHYFQGCISDIHLYARALSTAEAVALYMQEKDTTQPDAQVPETLDTTFVYASQSATTLPSVEVKATITTPIKGSTTNFATASEAAEPISPETNSDATEVSWTIVPTTDATQTSVCVTATYTYTVGGTTRVILPTITPGETNDYTDAVAYGPNIGPAYGITTKTADLSQQQKAPIPAGEGLVITYEIHPLTDEAENAITGVTLLYRADFGEIKTAPMTQNGTNWTGTIPGTDLPASGHLIRWAATLTDASERVWRSPSFCNPDDGYEWYGTIVEPSKDQLSDNLQTFHLFADSSALTNMDKQYDTISANVPYGARLGVYDSQTGTYYDNVRFDLRGNTTAGFKKKSHGIRFNKVQPLTCEGIEGDSIKEIRKTSFIAEYADPAYIRQSLAFWIFRKAGNLVPFDYPVRIQRNGEFYQLAFHSNRFSDELIEDTYGLDPYGYAYKSVGTFGGGTSGGGIEKKTPDDGDEKDLSVLNAFCAKIKKTNGKPITDATAQANVTKEVVMDFNLPAWLNYIATSRITHENDDIWANLCAYYDINGTDTWMPLAYDMNLSLGAWYYGDDTAAGRVVRPADDTFKSHPFYGGWNVRAYQTNSTTKTVGYGNYAYEAIFQNEKFRRLYLRRLRTVMDAYLKAPGTSKEATEFWAYAEKLQAAIRSDATLDRDKWGTEYKDTIIYVWDKTMTMDEGIEDLWDNYVVPRRQHLYETHSVTNTTKTIGYGSEYNAGIPEAQAANLKLDFDNAISTDGLTSGFTNEEVLIIKNSLDVAIDMSGWVLNGAVSMTLPEGTVIDQNDNLYIVKDRKSYIEKYEGELTDQIIVGNATFNSDATTLTLTDTANFVSAEASWEAPTAEKLALRVAEVMPNPVVGNGDTGEYIVVINTSTTETLSLEGCSIWCAKTSKTLTEYATFGAITLAPGETATYQNPDDSHKMTDGKVDMELRDSRGQVCETLYWSDEWYPITDGDGASLIATSWGETNITKDGWRPSFVAPADNTGSQSVKAAIEATPEIAPWLSGLSTEGATALEQFTGSTEDLTTCYLVGINPEATPEVELDIQSIEIDAEGNLIFTSGLNKYGTINGHLWLHTYDSLQEPATATIDLGVPTFNQGTYSPAAQEINGASFFKIELK